MSERGRWLDGMGLIRRMLLTVLLLPVLPLADIGNAAGQGEASFEEAGCPFALPDDLMDGTDVSCGYLSAPLFHDDPDGESVRLAVAILPSTAARPADEPLVILLGGPGQEVDSILPAFAPSGPISFRSLLDRQDVILIEQRGIGYSEPSLACPFDSVGGERAEINPNEVTDAVAALEDCVAGLEDDGIDLEAFTTIENAADVNDLREALGYDQVDLLGISYGTRLALTVMRDFPDAVRSAVLASPLPLQENVVAGQIISFDAALDQLFAACADDPGCDQAYPDLDASLTSAIEQLDDEPIVLDTENPLTGAPAEITVDGATFVSTVYVAIFIGPLLPLVPALINGVVSGQNFVLETLAPFTLIFTEGVSLGANYVYNCNEEFSFTDAAEVADLVEGSDVRPELADGDFAGSLETFEICDAVDVEPAEREENRAVASEVPALILVGEYDPITPPVYGEVAAETLPNSYQVVFPGVGHDPVSTAGSCGLEIIAEFLEEPGEEPDSSCVDELELEFAVLP